MIETTGDFSDHLSGWLRRYVEVTESSRFPVSFRALTGINTLSSLVGRKAAIISGNFILYPPVSILLLGLSGVGKSKTMQLGRQVAASAVGDGRAGFFLHTASNFTPAGLMEFWRGMQEEHNVGTLEGIVYINEASAILTSRTGSETVSQWMIDILEHSGTVTDFTKSAGKREISGVTVSFAMASTVDYLRKAISVDQFAGGFMHRFLIAHETKRPLSEEGEVEQEAIEGLAQEAAQIADEAPEVMKVSPEARVRIRGIVGRSEDRVLESAHLSGFWNRLGMMTLKLAGIFALSDEREEISDSDVERAETILTGFIYKPLAALVREMEAPGKKVDLYRLADDLFFRGEKGMLLDEFTKRLPTHARAAGQEMLDFMESSGLLAYSRSRKKVFRLKAWAEKGN